MCVAKIPHERKRGLGLSFVRAFASVREIIINNYGEVLGNGEGDNYTSGVCIARIHRYLASHDFQEESVFLVPLLSYPSAVLRGYLHAHYKGESRVEMVRQVFIQILLRTRELRTTFAGNTGCLKKKMLTLIRRNC